MVLFHNRGQACDVVHVHFLLTVLKYTAHLNFFVASFEM